MPTDRQSPVRMFLEIAVENIATLKVNHQLRPATQQYLRCFLESHRSAEAVLFAARTFAAHHGGLAQEVPQDLPTAPLITASFPLPEGASPERIVELSYQLLLKTEEALRTT